MSNTHQWTAAQLKAITEHRAELAVSAAAGSGKTAVLIERVLRAALGVKPDPTGEEHPDPGGQVSLDRMLVVTFTRAAAAELRARLQSGLTARAQLPRHERRVKLEIIREQMAALPRAQISTIHSFCGEVVRRYGHLAGLNHGRVIDEDEAALLRHDLATRFLDARLGAGADTGLRALALAWGGSDGVGPEDLSEVRFATGLRATMLRLLDFRRSIPDPDHWYRRACDRPPLDPAHCAPAHPVVAAISNQLDQWLARVTELDSELQHRLLIAPEARIHEILNHRLGVYSRARLDQGWDETGVLLRTLKDELPFRKGWNYLTGYRSDLKKAHPGLYDLVGQQNKPVQDEAKQWIEFFSQPWAAVSRHENEAQRLIEILWQLTGEFDDSYTAYKRERGIADFDDMQRDALRVLAAGDGDGGLQRDEAGRVLPSAAALELRTRYAMVLVDEHQDTNELQDTLIGLVTRDAPVGEAGGGRPRFCVGDLKQSIYTFRQAVPQLFAELRRRLSGLPDAVGLTIGLQTNFRSRPLLLSAVNQIFDGLLTEELGGEDYTANRLLAPDFAIAQSAAYPPERRDRPAELHLVPLAAGAGEDGAAEDDAADEAESPGKLALCYGRLAGVLRGIHDRGELIREKGGEFRPARWSDMVILMRSTVGRIETLLRVCTAAGIPVHAPGRSGFYERPEVADALSLLRIVDNPRQDIPLAAVLRGPAVGLTAAELLAVAEVDAAEPVARPDLWERVRGYCQSGADIELRNRLADFSAELRRWRTAARLQSVADLLWQLYADTGLLAAAAGLRGGEQRVANLYRLHDLARRAAGFERQGLARFLRALELNRRAAGDLGEAPSLTEVDNVVRVLTVHQSKGLEFPIVALPGLDSRFNLRDLNGDVLWHRLAGIGGRCVDWHLPPGDGDLSAAAADYQAPERQSTLSHRRVREAKRAESLAEELRILYVALTRARERLVLVSTVSDKQLEKFADEPADPKASCWLDWIGSKLSAGISAARESGASATCGAEGAWQVQIGADEGVAATAAIPVAAPAAISDEELAVIRRRLSPSYQFPGSSELGAKLAVTRLSHLPPQDADSDGIVEATPREDPVAPAAEVLPQFMREGASPDRRATAAEIGTGVHLLLAAVDLREAVTPAMVLAVRDRLLAGGRLDAAAGGAIDCEQIAEMLAGLQERLIPAGAELYPELPVALLVPGRDAELLAQLQLATGQAPAPEALHPGDQVYVQGVIDLLIVTGDSATVVDYKTDRNADGAELKRRYRRQLEWYSRMVRAMLPDKPVRWAILGLDSAGVVEGE